MRTEARWKNTVERTGEYSAVACAVIHNANTVVRQE